MNIHSRSPIQRVILRGFLAGAIYIVCWAGSLLVNINRDHFSFETGWWLCHRFLPGAADFFVFILLYRERSEKWWLSLLTAVALWGICIYFYPRVAINHIYTDPAHEWMDMSYKESLWLFHSVFLARNLFMTLMLLGIVKHVIYKWKQGFDDV